MPSLARKSSASPHRLAALDGGERMRSRGVAADTGGDRLWEIADVALYLGVPRSAVYKMTAPSSRNPIPHFKLGRLLRFRKVDIDAWLGLWAVSPVDALSRAQQQARGR